MAELAPLPRDLNQQAIHVGLVLVRRAVANPYRAGAAPAFQVPQLDFSQTALAIHGVQHLQVVGISTGGSLDEMPDSLGF